MKDEATTLKAELNASKSSLGVEKAKIASLKDEATALKAELNATSSAAKSSLGVEKATIASMKDETNALKAELNATKSKLRVENEDAASTPANVAVKQTSSNNNPFQGLAPVETWISVQGKKCGGVSATAYSRNEAV